MTKFTSVEEFIKAYKAKRKDGHFFDRDTLRFFGERISEMELSDRTQKVKDFYGKEHECYVLSALQRNCPDGLLRHTFYFDTDTLKNIVQ